MFGLSCGKNTRLPLSARPDVKETGAKTGLGRVVLVGRGVSVR